MASKPAAWRFARCAMAIVAAAWICPGAGAQEPATDRASTPAALPASLPLRREPEPAAGGGSWMVASGALVLLAFGGTLMAGRRRGWRWLQVPARHEPGPVRTASQSLTAQASVHAIRWNDEELLLGCTAQQVTVLARRPLLPGQESLS